HQIGLKAQSVALVPGVHAPNLFLPEAVAYQFVKVDSPNSTLSFEDFGNHTPTEQQLQNTAGVEQLSIDNKNLSLNPVPSPRKPIKRPKFLGGGMRKNSASSTGTGGGRPDLNLGRVTTILTSYSPGASPTGSNPPSGLPVIRDGMQLNLQNTSTTSSAPPSIANGASSIRSVALSSAMS